MRSWRGLLVALSWVLLPAAAVGAWLATGPHQCAGGDCYWLAPPVRTLAPFAAAGLALPAAATLAWRRWRYAQRRPAGVGARAG